MALRFGYFLMRVRSEEGGTHYDDLAFEEVSIGSDDELRTCRYRLRDWAAQRINEMNPELTLFYAVFSTIAEDDGTGWPFGTEHIVWDGHREIPTASRLRALA